MQTLVHHLNDAISFVFLIKTISQRKYKSLITTVYITISEIDHELRINGYFIARFKVAPNTNVPPLLFIDLQHHNYKESIPL